MSKIREVLFLLFSLPVLAIAQVGIGTPSPNSTAQLDITSTTKGLLPPRMNSTQRNAILSPATGLVIFNTTSNSLEIYSGSEWSALITAKTANYPNASYRDLVTYSFANANGTAGIELPMGSTNLLVFHQPPNINISYVSITYASSSITSPASLTSFSLYDMTDVAYSNYSGGTLIGTIFSNISATNTIARFQEMNTATAIGSFGTPISRPVAIRLTTSSTRFIVLSINIGYSAL